MDDKIIPAGVTEAEIAITETEIVIQARGKVTGPTYTCLSDLVRAGIAQGHLPISIHFQQATWIDSKSLSLLHTTGQQLILLRRSLTVHVRAGTQPCRVLEMSQMDQLLLLFSERNKPGRFAIVSHPAE